MPPHPAPHTPNPPPRPRDTCFYDGKCGFCRRSTSTLRRLDWLSNLAFLDMTTVSDLPVAMEVALQGMPMRTAAGRVLVGFPAIRRALLKTPVGFIPASFLYIPGLSHLGALAYSQIARHRARNCPLTPPP